MTGLAFPKPVRREKTKRRGLRQVSAKRAARIAAGEPAIKRRRWGVSSGHGTAYSRRERELGRMLFIRSTLACSVRGREGAGECFGHVQCAHLGDRAKGKKCPDSECAPLCARHHDHVDNPFGWYLRMSREDRWAWRLLVIAQAQAAWDALTPEHRANWGARAEAQKAARRRSAS